MRTNKTEKIILEIAEKEFLQKGYDGARIVEIADRAGVNQAMLYYYYKTKEQLFDRVFTEKMKQLQESVAVVFEIEEMTVVEKIVEVIVRHFDFLCENPDLPRFVINELSVRPEYAEKMKREGMPILRNVVERLQHDLDEAAREGEVREMDAATLLLDVLSVNFFSVISMSILGTVIDGFDREEYLHRRAEENVQLILNRINPDIQ